MEKYQIKSKTETCTLNELDNPDVIGSYLKCQKLQTLIRELEHTMDSMLMKLQELEHNIQFKKFKLKKSRDDYNKFMLIYNSYSLDCLLEKYSEVQTKIVHIEDLNTLNKLLVEKEIIEKMLELKSKGVLLEVFN